VITALELSDKTLDALAPDFDDDDNMIVRIEAAFAEKLVAKILKKAKQFELSDIKLIAPLEVRALLFALLSNYIPDITVLAREEIGVNATVEILGEV
jgi:flagellar biosynthesis component FlhA